MRYKLLVISVLFLTPMACIAQNTSLVLGADIYSSTWKGDYGGGDYSSEGGQLGLQAQLSRGKYYGGISLLSGTFKFREVQPNEPLNVDSITYQRTQFDVLGGYQFWEHISLFAGMKIIGYMWDRLESNEVRFFGSGFGSQWHYSITDKWMLFGHLALYRGGSDINNSGKKTTDGSSLVIGAGYRLNKNFLFQANLNSQSLKYSTDQTNNIGGLSIGVHYLVE